MVSVMTSDFDWWLSSPSLTSNTHRQNRWPKSFFKLAVPRPPSVAPRIMDLPSHSLKHFPESLSNEGNSKSQKYIIGLPCWQIALVIPTLGRHSNPLHKSDSFGLPCCPCSDRLRRARHRCLCSRRHGRCTDRASNLFLGESRS